MLADALSAANDTTLVLSFILPFFWKLAEFHNVLPLNLPHFAQPGREVILVLDDAAEAAAVVDLVRRHPGVRWKVLVNDVAHRWRPPCKAINVGLRHAAGTHVFIASPESAYVGDAPGRALAALGKHPAGIALGRVGFAQFDELRAGATVETLGAARIPERLFLDSFYGSICAPRAALEAVEGYAEDFAGWGSDDDNVRIRLEMAGWTLLACPQVQLVHLSFKPRNGPLHPEFDWDPDVARVKCSPASPRGNPGVEWGRSFSRVAYAADRSFADPAAAAPDVARIGDPRTDAGYPIRSSRRCRGCGRRVYFERPTRPCAVCGVTVPPAVPELSVRTG